MISPYSTMIREEPARRTHVSVARISLQRRRQCAKKSVAIRLLRTSSCVTRPVSPRRVLFCLRHGTLHRSIADQASHDSNYILLSDQPKSRAAAKTPLLTRVGVARQNGSGGIASARSAISLSNDPPPYSANRASGSRTFDAVRRDKERMTANGH